MVRTQIYLDEAIHRRLRELAEQQDRTVSDLIREALARAFGESDVDRRLATLERLDGLWRDRDDVDADAYVRRLRRDTHRVREG
jgi:predicted transcriptional regulator